MTAAQDQDARSRGVEVLAGLMSTLLLQLGDHRLQTVNCMAHKGERQIETWLSGMLDMGLAPWVLPGLPHSDSDSWRFQPPLPWMGAVDLMIYHADGTVSAVEIKDGAQGLNAGQKGVGQVTCAAVHMNPAVHIRRVLAWTPMEKLGDDQTLQKACRACGIVPILLPTADQRRRHYEAMVGLVMAGAEKIMKGGADGPPQ